MNIHYITLFVVFLTVCHAQYLVTKNRKGEYVHILNKDGSDTKWFKGGVYVKRGKDRYDPIHKRPEDNWIIAPPSNPNPGPDGGSGQIFGTGMMNLDTSGSSSNQISGMNSYYTSPLQPIAESSRARQPDVEMNEMTLFRSRSSSRESGQVTGEGVYLDNTDQRRSRSPVLRGRSRNRDIRNDVWRTETDRGLSENTREIREYNLNL